MKNKNNWYLLPLHIFKIDVVQRHRLLTAGGTQHPVFFRFSSLSTDRRYEDNFKKESQRVRVDIKPKITFVVSYGPRQMIS